MCGGPSQEQKDAASSQKQLNNAELDQFKSGIAKTTPFYTSQLTNPQQDPALADQFGKQKAMMRARMAGYGSALPSGFAEQEEADLGEQYGRAQDQNIFSREMAGASGLNPQQAAQIAGGGNESIMRAPLQNQFWSNLVGGIVRGGAQVASSFAGA